ncbi:MAG: flavin reductase [Ruminococcus sp.]|nr:flavin reductase [Ruminococcus sp.]
MHNTRKIHDKLYFLGCDNYRLAMFEGVYSVPKGVSFNSYLLLDNQTVLFDTVDSTVSEQFFENLSYALDGRKLDYLIIQHMEPDHSATLRELILRYPDVKIVCNTKTRTMVKNFFGEINVEFLIVGDGDDLCTGMHTFTFVFAPMVHWPEVMVTYDQTDKILYSADAFGTFGALGGALFADEVDFERDYLDEARRYYTNIVGKYGQMVQSLLKKAAGLDIQMIAPLHGFVWRKNIPYIIEKHNLWSSYTPEEDGVCIAFASIYGHTANAAMILAKNLSEMGIKTEVFDTSVTHVSDIVAACFKYSHIVFASSSYNAGMFVTMEGLVLDLVAHNIQNRTVTIIENGSWAPAAAKLIRENMSKCKNINILSETLLITSAVTDENNAQLSAIAAEIAGTLPKKKPLPPYTKGEINNQALFSMSYGLYLLSVSSEGKDNACIINSAMMITDSPKQLAITVNKANFTAELIKDGSEITLSVLTQEADFETFKRFGFASGKDTDKFDGCDYVKRAANGTLYCDKGSNAVIAAKVNKTIDCGTHMMYIAQVTEAFVLSDIPSTTYTYYGEHIKPQVPKFPKNTAGAPPKKGWVCKVCGYIYEGEVLPPEFICPLCKHDVSAFEKLG